MMWKTNKQKPSSELQFCRWKQLVDEKDQRRIFETDSGWQEVYDNPNNHYLQPWWREKHLRAHTMCALRWMSCYSRRNQCSTQDSEVTVCTGSLKLDSWPDQKTPKKSYLVFFRFSAIQFLWFDKVFCYMIGWFDNSTNVLGSMCITAGTNHILQIHFPEFKRRSIENQLVRVGLTLLGRLLLTALQQVITEKLFNLQIENLTSQKNHS